MSQLSEPATAADVAYFRRQLRWVVALVVVVTLAGAAVTTWREAAGRERDRIAERRVDDRDEATKYQRCAQTAQTAVQTNAARRDTLKVGRRFLTFFGALSALAGESATGTAEQRLALRNASDALARASLDAQANAEKAKDAPIPNCAALYPRGFDATRRLGPIIPTASTPDR